MLMGESRRIGRTEASVSAEGALLWVLHSLLCAHWGPAHAPSQPLELRAFAGNVGLLPAIVYPLEQQQLQLREAGETQQRGAGDAVEVRAIHVPQRLFVHFVSAKASVRLALVVGEYVKAATCNDSNTSTTANDRVLRVGDWLCSQELLRWRLERNVYPEFSSEPPALHAMEAELSKLPEPTLTHVYEFLRAAEFSRVTQANKYLHQLAENPSLWRQFLQRGMPAAGPASEKRQYVDQFQEKLRRDCARQAMIRLAMLWEGSAVRDGLPGGRGRGGGFDPLPPPAQPSVWLPPSPFLPGEMLDPEGRRRRRRDSDLDFDAELRPALDQRRREFIERWCTTLNSRTMRWGGRGPAVLTGSSRDEADAATVFPFASGPHAKAPLALKKPGPKPALTGTAVGRNVRPGKGANSSASEVPNGTVRAEESPVVAPANCSSQMPSLPSSFLVCAGKSVSSNNNDEHLEESSETTALHHDKRASAPNSSDPAKKTPAHSLQRSDSELELIISELREKISLQHRFEEEKRKLAIATASLKSSESGSGALDSSRSTGSNSEHHHHPRRHLKNPVERVNSSNPQGAAGVPILSSSSSNLLKRQQSASHMSRQLTTGNAVKLAQPTVVTTSISASSASRSNLMASASGVGNFHHPNNGSIFQDRGDLDAASYTRVYDDEGMLIKSYAQEPKSAVGNNSSHGSYTASHLHSSTGGNEVQRPIVYYGNADPTQKRSRRIRRSTPEIARRNFKLSLEPQQQQQSENNVSDSDSSSFGEDDNPFLLQCSLSPVGPWMASDGRHHPESFDSFDSQHYPSASSRFDLSPTTARSSFTTEDEFAELSPRSRLLWLSHCADNAENSPETFSSVDFLRQCQRSVSHPGTIRPSSAVLKASGAKPPPVRCSSAKVSSQSRRGPNSTSDFGGTKSKKRPQSGGSKTRKLAS